ncbi:hypothetical protein RRG08_033740 [Elysia crispata]|uniref:Uncharacterized protein n=1 Tax=Elysia crispata TaxID=231223 RepID=A0AAE1A9I8_9GAST|nr:hypothetical protein RRG08_033740 [Elysia crispata]
MQCRMYWLMTSLQLSSGPGLLQNIPGVGLPPLGEVPSTPLGHSMVGRSPGLKLPVESTCVELQVTSPNLSRSERLPRSGGATRPTGMRSRKSVLNCSLVAPDSLHAHSEEDIAPGPKVAPLSRGSSGSDATSDDNFQICALHFNNHLTTPLPAPKVGQETPMSPQIAQYRAQAPTAPGGEH